MREGSDRKSNGEEERGNGKVKKERVGERKTERGKTSKRERKEKR